MVWGLVGGMICCSCHDRPSFSGYAHVDRTGWYSEDTVVMEIQQADTTRRNVPGQMCEMQVGIRYTADYVYRDFSLLVELVSGRRVVARDTVLFHLFDEKGRASGRGLERYDKVQPSMRVVLKADKPYVVRMTHLMRLNPVPGITDVSCSFDSVLHPFAGE
ncbi:MAG: hypothetical protein IJT97_09035 [Bacteroidaceae bacterium]|nr:hypothetical protein [Bacteroidaceae bacterium]